MMIHQRAKSIISFILFIDSIIKEWNPIERKKDELVSTSISTSPTKVLVEKMVFDVLSTDDDNTDGPSNTSLSHADLSNQLQSFIQSEIELGSNTKETQTEAKNVDVIEAECEGSGCKMVLMNEKHNDVSEEQAEYAQQNDDVAEPVNEQVEPEPCGAVGGIKPSPVLTAAGLFQFLQHMIKKK